MGCLCGMRLYASAYVYACVWLRCLKAAVGAGRLINRRQWQKESIFIFYLKWCLFVRLDEYWVWNCDQGRHMPVLSLISALQADTAALSPLRRSVTSLGRSPNRHIPFVSAWRSLFTFQWLDIPIRAAPIYSFPLCRVQSLIFLLFLFSFSLTPSCSPPSTSQHTTGWLVWFSSLWRDPSAAFHIPSCLSVFLMAECMALWLQERCFMSAFK